MKIPILSRFAKSRSQRCMIAPEHGTDNRDAFPSIQQDRGVPKIIIYRHEPWEKERAEQEYSVQRLNPLDLREELIEYMEELATRSTLVASIVDECFVDDEIDPVIPLNRRSIPPPASKSALFQLRHVSVTRADKIAYCQDKTECLICTNRLIEGTSITQMPCKHVYHTECLVKWLQTTCSCPACRYEIKTDNPTYERRRRQHLKIQQFADISNMESTSFSNQQQQSLLCFNKFTIKGQ